ncbi:glycosyltransferase family 2 protein [Thioclava sp. BHET1]|nr:glycosyltransferase family 2 protein [Thioclava sp. BHET1]
MALAPERPALGVVIVSYRSGSILPDALESLLSAKEVALSIALVDNASPDDTIARLRLWAAGRSDYLPASDLPFQPVAQPKPLSLDGAPLSSGHRITLIPAARNGGFAAGVNLGLAHLAQEPELDRFWILNPDTLIPPATPARIARHPGPFALLGNRVLYLEDPGRIQIDGGTLDRRTGVTGNLHLGSLAKETPPPDLARMDFVMGASMTASRAFLTRAGPMAEDYFLYYEEVDWALRRGDMPLAFCPGAEIFHRAGSVIGSARLDRMATPRSVYFKHRARLIFLRRHLPRAVPLGYLWGMAKAAQMLAKGYPKQARALFLGMMGRPPPREPGQEAYPIR